MEVRIVRQLVLRADGRSSVVESLNTTGLRVSVSSCVCRNSYSKWSPLEALQPRGLKMCLPENFEKIPSYVVP